MLGARSSSSRDVQELIVEYVANVWSDILGAGLFNELRSELTAKYPIPANCGLASAPKLNEEIAIVAAPPAKTRDARLETNQTHIGAILSALSRSLTLIIGKEVSSDLKPLIEAVSDAGRLLADLHHEESLSRRQIIALDLNRELKTTLDQAPLGSLLFGENLGERIKN